MSHSVKIWMSNGGDIEVDATSADSAQELVDHIRRAAAGHESSYWITLDPQENQDGRTTINTRQVVSIDLPDGVE